MGGGRWVGIDGGEEIRWRGGRKGELWREDGWMDWWRFRLI